MLPIDLARIEFGLTAMYHFLFVPLTIGLPWALFIMEAIYVRTCKVIYRYMTTFWAKFFIITFLINIIAERSFNFEYAHNWAYFARSVGGAFGHNFALSNNIALVIMTTFVGLFFITWRKLHPCIHLLLTFFMASITSLYIINPMILNSWMQHPINYYIDYNTMTIHLNDFFGIYTQPLALIRIAHMWLSALLVTTMFILGISSYYLLKKQHTDFALRSFALATSLGLAAAVLTFFSGDANGIAILKDEPEKMAAVEGQWETQTPPAAWYLTAISNQTAQTNSFVIKIPYALSLIATHSLTTTVEGLKPLIASNMLKIQEGALAYQAMSKIHLGTATPQDVRIFNEYANFIGYGLLLKKYTENPATATPAQIQAAAADSIPQASPVFWAFRAMLGGWLICFLILAIGFYYTVRKRHDMPYCYLRIALYSIPIPYIAAESGWLLSEVGRQPWVVRGILPTLLGSSSLSTSNAAWGLLGFFIFFSLLLVGQIYLMFKFIRKGPQSQD